MAEKNTLKSSLEIFPFAHQSNENSSDNNISLANNIIVVHNEKVDNFEENLNARVTAIKNGECLEITIPEGIGESAFLSENAIKIIQLVSKLGCSKLRIIFAKKDVNDTETDNVLKNDPKGESLLNKKLQRSEFKGSGGKKGNKEHKTKKVNKGHGAKSESEKTKGNKVGKKSEIEVEDQQSVINNTKFVDVDIFSTLLDSDIKPFDDNVFHIAEAIIAKTLDFGDKKLGSDEGNVSGDDVKNKVRSLISTTKSSIENMPLSGLPSLLEKETTAFKRATTKLLAKVCENVFNVIRHDKDIQKCVNDLSSALIDYAKNRTNCSEDESINKCKNIITTQENLKKLIKDAGHMENVNEVLNFAFVRVAVDKFYQQFGDLGDPKVLLDIKSTFNSLIPNMLSPRTYALFGNESLQIDFPARVANLVYGFGFYPSSQTSIAIQLLELGKGGIKYVLSALSCFSEENGLEVSGEKFEIFNTGSFNDRNCAFRAISVGDGYGPNGYNRVQQKVVDGANWALENWETLNEEKKKNILEMFKMYVDSKCTLDNAKELLREYIDCHRQGFVSGVQDIEYLFAAAGLKRPICLIKEKNSSYYERLVFFADYTGESYQASNSNKYNGMIYVGEIHGHAEALIPIDSESSQNVKNNTELNGKALKIKNLIKKRILNVIHDAICDANKRDNELCKIITGKKLSYDTDSFVPKLVTDNTFCEKAKKNKPEFFLVIKMFDQILKRSGGEQRNELNKLERFIKKYLESPTSYNDEEIEDALGQFADIFADKAVKLCQKKPLFWKDFENSLLRKL